MELFYPPFHYLFRFEEPPEIYSECLNVKFANHFDRMFGDFVLLYHHVVITFPAHAACLF